MSDRPRQGTVEHLADLTHGVVTPANVLDVVAMAGVAWSAPRLDRWAGVAVAAPSYLADVADGVIARRTHTASSFGEVMDHVVGDKPKLFYGLYHIWRQRLADRPLLGLVAAYNAANAAVTGYDWLRNAEPQVHPTPTAKRAMFASAAGVGLQVIAVGVARTHPKAGSVLRWTGAATGYLGVVVLGVPTTRGYWRVARSGPKRRR